MNIDFYCDGNGVRGIDGADNPETWETIDCDLDQSPCPDGFCGDDECDVTEATCQNYSAGLGLYGVDYFVECPGGVCNGDTGIDPEVLCWYHVALLDDCEEFGCEVGASVCNDCQTSTIDSISTNYACEGDTVEIIGENLCYPLRVLIEAVPIANNLILSSTGDGVSFIVPEVQDNWNEVKLFKSNDGGGYSYTNALDFFQGTLGCTDSGALNYDSEAHCDDSSCEYEEESSFVMANQGENCIQACGYTGSACIIDDDPTSMEGTELCDTMLELFGTDLGISSWSANLDVSIYSWAPSAFQTGINWYCLYNSGATPSTCDAVDPVYNSKRLCNCGVVTGILGCTDPEATNYDLEATIDDGSCEYDIYGCTDPEATNYDLEATIDDGSCEYEEASSFVMADPGENCIQACEDIDKICLIDEDSTSMNGNWVCDFMLTNFGGYLGFTEFSGEIPGQTYPQAPSYFPTGGAHYCVWNTGVTTSTCAASESGFGFHRLCKCSV